MNQPEFLAQVEQFLATRKVAASRLGRDALGDPRFVAELRAGRAVRPATQLKITAYMGEPQWQTHE